MTAKNNTRGDKLICAASMFTDQDSQTNGLLLAESLRAFAGEFSKAPLWYFIPEDGINLTAAIERRLRALNVQLVRVNIEPEILRTPLGAEACLAAQAELTLESEASYLAWLGLNSIVLQAPVDFLLPEGKQVGVRPVHHTLIGSRFDQPLDAFWELVYDSCHVPRQHIFPMITHVDAIVIRPYFNAGQLVVRPEEGLLRAWRRAFVDIYWQSAMQAFYRKEPLYKIFVHQALLTGVILAKYAPNQIHILPPTYNYPLHLYTEDISGTRPDQLDDLVTFRHEGFYRDPDWSIKMPAQETLKHWLAERLA
ncbi:MAG: hypothetical protein JSV61_06730 [Anaerolineales bacterium]|nr:MAG: hypothetical protein JSV61_06730 [Anaerolineales bacterium]